MKTKILTLMTFVLIGFNSFSQSNIWTKDDRNNIYNDCLSYIGKYPNLTPEQKESISICYLNELTKQYTKLDYQNKIDVEIRKIRETTLTLCAKNLGLDLSEQKKGEPKIEQPKEEGNKETDATKEKLIGHWKAENSEFWLFETGDYKMQYSDGKSAKGTWKIDSNQLFLYKDKFIGTSEKTFKILIFTKDKFVYQSMKKKDETFTAIRLK
jgi:hypothetical protein